MNQTNADGWHTTEPGDWIYYPQQYVNVSVTAVQVSIVLVGGCCAPKRNKSTGFLYQDDGSSYKETGNKIVAISDRPISQNISVTGWYFKSFVDDGAVNLTLIPTINHPDKQSILYETVAFDRAMLINYAFYDSQGKLLGNTSTGVIRNLMYIQDITLPRYTRNITYFLNCLCSKLQFIAQEQILCAFLICMQVCMPSRFLCRTPSNKIYMCIVIMLGSFISNQAWNMLNSESTMFHEWLPRAARIIGAYLTLTLFCLRLSIDLPVYTITYARSPGFLSIILVATIPTIAAFFVVILYFFIRSIQFNNCTICNMKLLEVEDIEEKYVSKLMKKGKMKKALVLTTTEKKRIPFTIKSALTLLIYCLTQLIPLLLLRMIGTGGVVPTHICLWSPYLVQLHYEKDALKFATKTFYLMRIVVYFATLGGGFTGTLYTMIEISLIGTFIAMVIQLDIAREFMLKRVGYGAYFASFLIAIVVQYIQKRITNLIFIEPRTRFVAHHRAPFLHYWYFMMLTSMTRALTSYFLRTLKCLVRYPIYSLRVDRNAETWSVRNGDAGFTAYCGMLLTDHEYNNPIVIVFIECIFECINCSLHNSVAEIEGFLYKDQKSLCETHCVTNEEEINVIEKVKYPKRINDKKQAPGHLDTLQCLQRSKRARTRWFLAYTLINNPQVHL
ncbi:hypothetical protein BY458DRAFT_533343 [Sporodiniella umbellata]|nr:hypothetical protein BY458DRAFT_533343 [Sporodiniella umbellata]